MAQRINLKANTRVRIGSSGVKKARNEGKIPAVLYGHGEPQSLELSAVELVRAVNAAASENVLVDLEINNKKHLALIQEIQHHPLKDKVVHVDFHEIDPNKKLHTEVPVHEKGESIGVKNGGVLDHLMRHIRVECLPQDLPSGIEVDISSLDIGQAIHVGELPVPAGVAVLNATDLPVFMVHAPRTEDETAAPAAGTAAEPEVITQKKDKEAAGEEK